MKYLCITGSGEGLSEVSALLSDLDVPLQNIVRITHGSGRNAEEIQIFEGAGIRFEYLTEQISKSGLDCRSEIKNYSESPDVSGCRLKPFKLAGKYKIQPVNSTDIRRLKKTGSDEIMIIPGTSFGAGAHPTTGLLAEKLMESLCAGDDVMDIGCGSGILLILAKLQGARRIAGFEPDADSATVARRNLKLNGVTGKIIQKPVAERESGQRYFDKVCANLESRVLEVCSSAVKSWVRPGGMLMISGVIGQNIESVKKHYCDSSFSVTEHSGSGEWSRLCLIRN